MPGQYIYLIEAENGLVKIGLGQNVRDRLTAARTHSPCRVRLIAQWPGTPAVDAMLKARFGAQRRHCEWFACEGEFADFVADWRGHGVDHVPEWPDLAYENAEDYRRARRAAAGSGSRRKAGAPARANAFGLTPQQARCLAIIREHNQRLGCSPSYAELAEALVLKSKSGVHRLVHNLVRRGHLQLLPGAGRTIALLEPVASTAKAA